MHACYRRECQCNPRENSREKDRSSIFPEPLQGGCDMATRIGMVTCATLFLSMARAFAQEPCPTVDEQMRINSACKTPGTTCDVLKKAIQSGCPVVRSSQASTTTPVNPGGPCGAGGACVDPVGLKKPEKPDSPYTLDVDRQETVTGRAADQFKKKDIQMLQKDIGESSLGNGVEN